MGASYIAYADLASGSTSMHPRVMALPGVFQTENSFIHHHSPLKGDLVAAYYRECSIVRCYNGGYQHLELPFPTDRAVDEMGFLDDGTLVVGVRTVKAPFRWTIYTAPLGGTLTEFSYKGAGWRPNNAFAGVIGPDRSATGEEYIHAVQGAFRPDESRLFVSCPGGKSRDWMPYRPNSSGQRVESVQGAARFGGGVLAGSTMAIRTDRSWFGRPRSAGLSYPFATGFRGLPALGLR